MYCQPDCVGHWHGRSLRFATGNHRQKLTFASITTANQSLYWPVGATCSRSFSYSMSSRFCWPLIWLATQICYRYWPLDIYILVSDNSHTYSASVNHMHTVIQIELATDLAGHSNLRQVVAIFSSFNRACFLGSKALLDMYVCQSKVLKSPWLSGMNIQTLPSLQCAALAKKKERKVYAVRRHDGSFCLHKQPALLL